MRRAALTLVLIGAAVWLGAGHPALSAEPSAGCTTPQGMRTAASADGVVIYRAAGFLTGSYDKPVIACRKASGLRVQLGREKAVERSRTDIDATRVAEMAIAGRFAAITLERTATQRPELDRRRTELVDVVSRRVRRCVGAPDIAMGRVTDLDVSPRGSLAWTLRNAGTVQLLLADSNGRRLVPTQGAPTRVQLTSNRLRFTDERGPQSVRIQGLPTGLTRCADTAVKATR